MSFSLSRRLLAGLATVLVAASPLLLGSTTAHADSVVTTISTPGALPQKAVFTPDGRYAYVLDAGGLNKLDLSNNTFTSSIPVGTAPLDMVISPDGAYIYVTNEASQSVSIVSTVTDSLVRNFSVSAPTGPFSPRSIAISPNGRELYVSNSAGRFLAVINVSNPASPADDFVDMNMNTWALTVSKDGGTLFTSARGGGVIKKVIISSDDESTWPVSTWITPPGNVADYLNISPDGAGIYATNVGAGLVTRFNAAGAQIAQYSGASPGAIGFSRDSSRVYVTSSSGGGTLLTLQASDMAVLSTLVVQGAPSGVQVDAAGTLGLVMKMNNDQVTRVALNAPPVPAPSPNPSTLADTGAIEYHASWLMGIGMSTVIVGAAVTMIIVRRRAQDSS